MPILIIHVPLRASLINVMHMTVSWNACVVLFMDDRGNTHVDADFQQHFAFQIIASPQWMMRICAAITLRGPGNT